MTQILAKFEIVMTARYRIIPHFSENTLRYSHTDRPTDE